MKSLLLEPREVTEEVQAQPVFKSMRRPSWKETQMSLSKKAHKLHKELESSMEVE